MADKYSNGQTRQNMDLPPSEGDGGYVGDNVESPLGTTVISGKGGYVESKPIWTDQSSGDAGGDPLPDFDKAGQDSTDEKADYKQVDESNGMPVTYRTNRDYDGAPASTSENNNTQRPMTQKVPSATEGEHELSAMPQTAFTHEGGSGIPSFKISR